MFFLVYKHLKIRIIMFSLPQNDVGSGSSSLEIAMLHRHDTITVVQKGQTKHCSYKPLCNKSVQETLIFLT